MTIYKTCSIIITKMQGLYFMSETKREKFIRIAENRTNKALEIIRLIGNLSNKNVYDYSSQDIQKIFTVLEHELALAKKQFTGVGGNDKFKLL